VYLDASLHGGGGYRGLIVAFRQPDSQVQAGSCAANPGVWKSARERLDQHVAASSIPSTRPA